MDDDENRTLDFNEFKKGIREYGLHLEPKVSLTYFFAGAALQNKVSIFCNDLEYLHSTLLSLGWGHVVNLQK